MLDNDDLRELLEEGLKEGARGLVDRIKRREFSAADVAQIRGMARDAGITLSFAGKATPVGDDVLETLKDVDLDLLN